MKQNLRSKVNHKKAKTVLRLPDLEYARATESCFRGRHTSPNYFLFR